MTAETRRTRHSRRQLIESWRRGWDRATWLGMAPLQIIDMEGGDSDVEVERRLFALANWVRHVEASEWPQLWSEARGRGIDAVALAAEDDIERRVAELKAVLGNGVVVA